MRQSASRMSFGLSRPALLCTGLAMLVFVAAGLRVAGRSSATYDEVPHIGAGLSMRQGGARLNLEHPPLVKMLAAAGLPEREPPLPPPLAGSPRGAEWSYGSEWLHGAGQSPLALLFRARLPLVLLNALLIPCLALVTQALAGTEAACVAAALLALCPLWLAHATLVATDAMAALLAFASTACALALTRVSPRRRGLASAALAVSLALSLATKYSLLALLPLLPLGFMLEHRRRRELVPWMLGAVLAGGVLGVFSAWGWPPRPGLYWEGLTRVGANHPRDYPFYAFGSFFTGRSASYFVRALLVKVSVPVLTLAALGVVSGWIVPAGEASTRTRTATSAGVAWLFLVPPLGYRVLISAAAPAIGVRYVLPVLPFLLVLAGRGGAALLRLGGGRLWLGALLALQVWGFTVALRATPIAFFNGLGCRTGDAMPCLDDSNVDWGQALPALERFRDERYPGVPVRVFYYGTSPVAAYLEDATAATIEELAAPRPALYALSLHLRPRCPEASWARRLRPTAVVGGAYAVFDLRALDPRESRPRSVRF